MCPLRFSPSSVPRYANALIFFFHMVGLTFHRFAFFTECCHRQQGYPAAGGETSCSAKRQQTSDTRDADTVEAMRVSTMPKGMYTPRADNRSEM